MAPRILRPLSYGDLFDEVFDLYKKHFVLFVGITAVINVPAYAIIYAFAGSAASMVAGVFRLVFMYVPMAATTWAVSRCYLGQEATIADSYMAIIGRVVPFTLTMIAACLIIGIGFWLVIPGIIFCFWYAFIAEVYVLEYKTGKDARNRSKYLASGHWGRIFVIWLLSFILMGIVAVLVTRPIYMIGGKGIMSAGGPLGLLLGIVMGVSSAVTTPIQILAFVLLYYDIRVRKEGFDIEMLTASMGGSIEPTPAVPDEVK